KAQPRPPPAVYSPSPRRRLRLPRLLTPPSLRYTASARGQPISICSPASAMRMRGRQAIWRFKKLHAWPSVCRPGRPRRRCTLWLKHGGPCGPLRRECCGHAIARSKGGKARRSSREETRRASEARMAAELDGPRLAPRSGAARQLVVFLHGYGADGNDLIEIGRAWQQLLPQAAFVAPHAPEPCAQAPVGRQWFGLTFRDPNERWV